MINVGERNEEIYVMEITHGDKDIFEILADKKGITMKELMYDMIQVYSTENSSLLSESLKKYQELKQAI